MDELKNQDKALPPVPGENDSAVNSPEEKPTPPPTPDEEWAKKLGLNFDPEVAKTLPPVPEETAPKTQPLPPPPLTTAPNFGKPIQAAAQPHFQSGQPEGEPMPDSYMLWSVLSLVFCCFPTAIVAIIYSAQVSSKYYAKDYEGAKKASERAQMWIIASVVLGVISAAVYFPLTLFTS